MNLEILEQTKQEYLYGIYHVATDGLYDGAGLGRQAGIVIDDLYSAESIIAHLIASDFLSQYQSYAVTVNTNSIWIHYEEGGNALILRYEGEFKA